MESYSDSNHSIRRADLLVPASATGAILASIVISRMGYMDGRIFLRNVCCRLWNTVHSVIGMMREVAKFALAIMFMFGLLGLAAILLPAAAVERLVRKRDELDEKFELGYISLI